jgi:hypothetical protein
MTTNFNVAPFNDDFVENALPENYLRILFRPGYAVQARELTQIQSILQNQINEFGNFIFQNGSVVSGGNLTYDNTVSYVKIALTYNSGGATVSINPNDFVGQIIENGSGFNGAAKVKAYVQAVDTTTAGAGFSGLIVKYLTGETFSPNMSIRMPLNLTNQAQILSGTDAVGIGSIVHISDGVFYSDGYFVTVPSSFLILDTYDTAPSYRVGLQISENIINETQDTSLLDPAQASFNYQAPGAERYQRNLILSKRSLTSTDDSLFTELLRIEKGLITKQVKYPVLGDIVDTLAKRTYDQSGNFTVNPFVVTPVDIIGDSANVQLEIDPGKAYIEGYEFETVGKIFVNLPKAQSTDTATNFVLNNEFRNYVTVTNFYSGNVASINAPSYTTLDLHLVPSAAINTSNALAYSATKIGTAKVRYIDFNSSTSTGNNRYDVYLTDINTSPLVIKAGINNTSKSNTINVVSLGNTTSYFSNLNSAYNNVTIQVTDYNSPVFGDIRKVISYDSGTGIVYLDRSFSGNTVFGSANVSFNFGTVDISSLVYPPTVLAANVFRNQNVSTALFPCMDVDTSSISLSGNTTITDSNKNCLIFPLPQNYIAQGSINPVTYYSRQYFPAQPFTSGSLSTNPGSGTIFYGQANQPLSNKSVNTHIYCFVTANSAGSNAANGTIVDFTRDPTGTQTNVIVGSSLNTVTLHTGYTGNFTADVYVDVELNNNGITFPARRNKTLRGNTSSIHTEGVLLPTDTPAIATTVSGSSIETSQVDPSHTKIDRSNGYVWFTQASTFPKTPGTPISLYISDVISIVKIFDSGNTSYAPANANSLIDITDNYALTSGQTDNYYNHASISLKYGYNPPVGQVLVMVKYYDIDETQIGFFDNDSYSSDIYSSDSIPSYQSRSGNFFLLRDSIDFRPTRRLGYTSFTLKGSFIPIPDQETTLTYSYYLPRIDKLTLQKDLTFHIVPGVPSLNPVAPLDPKDSMTLYTMGIPPYTAKASDIIMKYFDHRRYTMDDIGRIDKRLVAIEQYAVMTELEKSTTSSQQTYADGVTSKEIFGAIVDSFDDQSIVDFTNGESLCSVDKGQLSPYVRMQPIELLFKNYNPIASGIYKSKHTFMLDWTESAVISQPFATKHVVVEPADTSTPHVTSKVYPANDPIPHLEKPPINHDVPSYPLYPYIVEIPPTLLPEPTPVQVVKPAAPQITPDPVVVPPPAAIIQPTGAPPVVIKVPRAKQPKNRRPAVVDNAVTPADVANALAIIVTTSSNPGASIGITPSVLTDNHLPANTNPSVPTTTTPPITAVTVGSTASTVATVRSGSGGFSTGGAGGGYFRNLPK